MTAAEPVTGTTPAHVRVAIVGTGFAGLGAAIALQQEGVEHVILERAHDVGGTWRDNTYPGCRCDVPSHLYSFSFAPNPDWTETYSPQPEIQAYLRDTAERFGVVERVRFGHELQRATWDAQARRWLLDTAAGPLTADVLVLGNGPLAEPALPDLPGLADFRGEAFHSARWRHDVDLTGQRVGVIGTGASAIQFVPAIRRQAAKVAVFQRTPPWVLPHSNRRITKFEQALYRRFPLAQRLARAFVYWTRELFVTGLLRNAKGLERLEAIARRHLARQVPDPELRAKVLPDYRPGCKRLLLSDDWYPALQEPNVDLITEKIVSVTADSVVTADGVEHQVDTIIFGTGFHVTDNPIADRIVGTDGRTMAEHWADTGAQAYLGTAIPSFPNLFMLAGPNTGIGHTSLVVMIEAQLAYLRSALRFMADKRAGSIEVRRPVFKAWSAEVQRKAARTVWNSGGCASWYLDAEGRNTTIWPDHTFRFVRRTRRFNPSKYEVTA
jgi:cation diffusion facilitator CzcD-associated flavoprotein CzcO